MLSVQGAKISSMRHNLYKKLQHAKTKGCIQNPKHCTVIWSDIEELSSTIHTTTQKMKYNHEKTDLDSFCVEYPWEDECSAEYFIYAS
jgi:hypothetical protein